MHGGHKVTSERLEHAPEKIDHWFTEVGVTSIYSYFMEVTSVVWKIIHDLHRVAQLQRRGAATSPLGPVPLGVLNLAAQSPVRPSEVAAELDVPAQSVTRAVAQLEEKGLVRRVGDASDGRSYVIELTPEGHKTRREFQEELIARFARHLADWDPSEVESFADQLGRLVSSLAADVSQSSRAATPNPWRGRR
ncbi:hypothetical protein GCM10027416_09670 [Okibacterium endophyticum]